MLDGSLDGISLRSLDGVLLGLLELDGISLGSLDGVSLGLLDKSLDGISLGRSTEFRLGRGRLL